MQFPIFHVDVVDRHQFGALERLEWPIKRNEDSDGKNTILMENCFDCCAFIFRDNIFNFFFFVCERCECVCVGYSFYENRVCWHRLCMEVSERVRDFGCMREVFSDDSLCIGKADANALAVRSSFLLGLSPKMSRMVADDMENDCVTTEIIICLPNGNNCVARVAEINIDTMLAQLHI